MEFGPYTVCAMKSFLAVAAAFAPVSAWAAETPAEPYPWMHPMMWGGGWYGMIFGPLLMILVLAVVSAVAVLIARSLSGPWRGQDHPHIGDAVIAGAQPNRHGLAVVRTVPVEQHRSGDVRDEGEEPDCAHHVGLG